MAPLRRRTLAARGWLVQRQKRSGQVLPSAPPATAIFCASGVAATMHACAPSFPTSPPHPRLMKAHVDEAVLLQ